MHPELEDAEAQALNVPCHAAPHCLVLTPQLIWHVCQEVADSIDGAESRCLLSLQVQAILRASNWPLPAQSAGTGHLHSKQQATACSAYSHGPSSQQAISLPASKLTW